MRVSSLTDSRILIVDDQTDNLRVLAAVLEFAGYTNVTCLSDSRQLLFIQLASYSVVVIVHDIFPSGGVC